MISPLRISPKRFRALRENAGASQAETARQIGVSGAALCQYERKGRGVGWDRLREALIWLLSERRAS